MWLIFVFACVLFTSANAQNSCEKLSEDAEIKSLEQAGVAVNNLAINLYKHLAKANPDKDVIFSPASIALALAFIEAGADGNTKWELKNALLPSGLNVGPVSKLYSALNRKLRINDDDTKVSIANALFYAQGLDVQKSYSDKIGKCYNTEINEVPFASDPESTRREINQWVSEETEGKITELFKENVIDKNTLAVLANAIYLKAKWDEPFDQTLESLRFASTRSGPVLLEFMRKQGQIQYAKTNKFEAVSIPYSNSNLSMVFLLPNERGRIQVIDEGLQLVDIQQVFTRLRLHDVTVKIPRFATRQSLDLKKVLERLGVKDIFSDSANFTGIVAEETISTTIATGIQDDEEPTLRISTGIHQAFIKVTRRGTEAATAGAGIKPVPSPGPAVRPLSTQFIADHPFIFAIVDTSVPFGNWPILFLGKVMLPEFVQ